MADARSAVGDVNVLSHAHADHSPSRAGGTVVCSGATAALVEARGGVTVDAVEEAEGVSLLPSGHIVGSRAALVEADDGRRVLYTGDVSTRDRAYLSGFEPVDADVLVVESTYGVPAYRFPPQAELDGRIRDWVADTPDPLVLFGYSLGRAQKLQHLLAGATNRRVVVHPSVKTVNDAVGASTDLDFPAPSLDDVDLGPDDVVVAPSGFKRSKRYSRLVSQFDPVTAGFSGWAADDSYRYRAGVDEAFVFTDHCDFDELVALVEAVDPEKVYTHHGFDDAFASYLAAELGYDAVSLKRNQATLDDF